MVEGSKKVFLGIDLGTTNCSLSYCGQDSTSKIQVVDIPQIINSGVVTSNVQLPSAIYITIENEFKETDFKLPWDVSKEIVVGQYAKGRASEVPDRVVLSAKSWLCQTNADRKANILPWNSNISEEKISNFKNNNPDYWKTYYLTGLYYYNTRQYQKAITDFETALQKEITTLPNVEECKKLLKKSKRKAR